MGQLWHTRADRQGNRYDAEMQKNHGVPLVLPALLAAALFWVTAFAGAQPVPARPAAAPAEKAFPSYAALYQMLLSEIAAQRGEQEVAIGGLMDLAERSRDPRVAQRAAEIAFQSRRMREARSAVLLWLDIDPNAATARQALGVLVGVQGGRDRALENLNAMLRERERPAVVFTHLAGLLARYPEKAETAKIVAEMALPFSELPEAHYAVAVSAFAAGQLPAAEGAVDEALKRKPTWGRAAVMKAQLLRARTDALAADYLEKFLAAQPDEHDVRIAYARLLVGMKSLLKAREQFRLAAEAMTNDAEPIFSAGLISQEIGDYRAAEAEFKRALQRMPRDRYPILFNLGIVAEAMNERDAAMAWLRQIEDGDLLAPAQLRLAKLIAKGDGLAAARRHLQAVRDKHAGATELANQLVLAESQLLRDAKDFEGAYQVLSEAVEREPRLSELRYDRAMVAEKMNKLTEMEADLRAVIAIKPDHAHAFNALGYTFAERGIRLDEAEQLINEAVRLAPNDPFILDSMGWVQYRRGKLSESRATLEKAYGIRADAEIAAHLGEVLLALGLRNEAGKLVAEALRDHPGNEALVAVSARIGR